MTFSPLPRLRTANSSSDCIEYSTGAKYVGKVEGKRRKGSGTFHWPNGAKYEGEFADNRREGQGVQEWPDGSLYEGVFSDDLRHGQGTQTWQDGSKYTGLFFRDRRHGRGHYIWADGSSFLGQFYTDRREGYGKFTYSNGNVFEGLYKKDERFGPGVLTYTDGRQDVGIWLGERLVKLLSCLEDRFSMRHHKELDYCVDDHKHMIQLEDRYYNKNEVLEHIIHPPPAFNYKGNEHLEENSKGIFSDSLHPESLAMDCEVFEKEFFGEEGTKEADTVEAINSTPILIDIQKYVHRHRKTEKELSFSIKPFEEGNRDAFKSSAGSLEQKSRELIEASLNGNKDVVQNLLLTGELSPDVSDCSGFTPLQAAVTNCNQAIINMLLDAGADVNKLNDEGLSALAQCFVYYYPVDSFKENIAEKEYLIPKTNGSVDEYGYIEVIAIQSVNADEFFYHYVRRDRRSLFVTSSGSITSISQALVLSNSINKISSKDQLSQLNPEEDLVKNKAPSPTMRDSGFASRKDQQNLPPASEAGTSSAVTTTSEEMTGAAGSQAMSQMATPNPSERYKSPSAISHITGNTKEISEPDGLSTDEEEKNRKRLSISTNRLTKPRVSLRVLNTNDEISVLSSQAMSQISNNDDMFHSDARVLNYSIKVKDKEDLIDRCATALSHNDMVTKRDDGSANSTERTRLLAKRKAMKNERWETMKLLLRRGANPNVCSVPMPALVFTIKAGDMEATKLLLLKGADANLRLPEKKGGLSPLHLAAGTPGEEGILITDYLLNALSDPDARATADNSYLDPDDECSRDDEWDFKSCEPPSLGRTPLHIACSRDDDYESAARIVHLLLDHKANPDVLCNGHSPLSLAIISGNDEAISALLKYKANPSLSLTHGNGNALCVASHTAYEHRRSPDGRIDLIDKLVSNGGDILANIPIGPKKIQGTALDYAYHIFNLDRRIAHMPYHALSYSERETYNARRRLLGHMGDVVRQKCVERERRRIEDEIAAGNPSRSPSARFSFMGTTVRPTAKGSDATDGPAQGEGRVKFEVAEKVGDSGTIVPTIREMDAGVVTIGPYNQHNQRLSSLLNDHAKSVVRKPLFKYCYECGRSVNVRLTPCTRCKEVYFCSKNCKVKAWNARHKDECVRMQGSKNPSRAASHAKSAPAKYGGRGTRLASEDQKRAARNDKSYNMLRRPTDKVLVPRKFLSNSQPNLMNRRNQQTVRHDQGGGRMSPDLTPYTGFIDNYSFN